MSKKVFATVIQAFMDSLERDPHRTAIHVVESREETFAVSYADLYRAGRCAAKGFEERRLNAVDRVIIAIPTSREFFSAYIGALFSGVIPIIVPAPRPNRPMMSYAEHLDTIGKVVGAKYVVVTKEVQRALAGPSSLALVTVASLCGNGESQSLDVVANETDIAHLQATSGTTGSPKFAIVRHRNIAANVKGIGVAIQHRAGDSLVTWLPFYHDMGLIGISYALLWQCPLIATDPRNFVRNPIFWLEMLTRFGGTVSPAPNSAFHACARLARRRVFQDLDLSRWRVALCGAEPVHEETIRDFARAFERYGFRETTMLPVYGLAEATLAATIPDVNTVPYIDSIDAELMELSGRCTPPAADSKRQLNMVSVGTAIEGHRVGIVNKDGLPLGEREIGEIEFAGPSVVDEYWGNPRETTWRKGSNGVLRTGDLGYLADRQLYVTGRQKDIIIINGRNLVPAQIEAIVEKAIGRDIVHGIVAWGLQDSQSKTESLHLMIESRIVPPTDQTVVEDRVRNALEEVFGLSGVTIHWVRKGKIPKTTSGKIQRHSCRELIPETLR